VKVDHDKTAPGHATSRTLRGDAPPVYCLDSASENDQEPLPLPAKWVGWMGRLEACLLRVLAFCSCFADADACRLSQGLQAWGISA
jgi:hypothetical protein